MTQRVLSAAQILWPAFLMAGVLEMVVFSWVDPSRIQWGSWHPDPQTTYSLAFLTFWMLIAGSSLVTHWMARTGTSPMVERRARRQAKRHGQAPAGRHHHAREGTTPPWRRPPLPGVSAQRQWI